MYSKVERRDFTLLVGFFLGTLVSISIMVMQDPNHTVPTIGARKYQEQLVTRKLAHWEANPRTGITTLVIDGPCLCDPPEQRHQ